MLRPFPPATLGREWTFLDQLPSEKSPGWSLQLCKNLPWAWFTSFAHYNQPKFPFGDLILPSRECRPTTLWEWGSHISRSRGFTDRPYSDHFYRQLISSGMRRFAFLSGSWCCLHGRAIFTTATQKRRNDGCIYGTRANRKVPFSYSVELQPHLSRTANKCYREVSRCKKSTPNTHTHTLQLVKDEVDRWKYNCVPKASEVRFIALAYVFAVKFGCHKVILKISIWCAYLY